MNFRRRAGVLAATLAATGVLLSSCTAPSPQVTFSGDRQTVTGNPTLWCTVDAQASEFNCPAPDLALAPRLALRPGQPVEIDVPAEIGSTPWQVYFQYTDSSGTGQQARTAVFSNGKLAYTLFPLHPADQITRVEVQAGLTFVPGQDSGVDVAATKVWVLLIDPDQA